MSTEEDIEAGIGWLTRIKEMATEMVSLRATIEALNKRIEELEAERRWIPVEERLPDVDHTDVIVVRNGEVETLRFAYGNFYDFGYEQDGVTHWQPVPRGLVASGFGGR